MTTLQLPNAAKGCHGEKINVTKRGQGDGAKIKGTTMGAVAAETNSSLPPTALLATATGATPPAAIKTSTCGGPAAFGGGLLLCSLQLSTSLAEARE